MLSRSNFIAFVKSNVHLKKLDRYAEQMDG